MSEELTQNKPLPKKSLFKEWELSIRSGWKIVAVCVVIGIVYSVITLRAAVYTYPVQMQVMAVQASSDDSGSKLSQLSGLAALANVSLPSTPSGMQFRFYMDAFTSRDLADEIAKDQNLMKVLFANQWDPINQVWREPPRSASQNIMEGIRSFLGLAPAIPWKPPGGAAIQSYLSDSVQVQQDVRKPYLAKITLNSYDRKFGVEFLSFLNQSIDNFLRQKAIKRSRAYIAYLSKQIQTVTIAEHRMAITQALSDQERYAMVASSGTPFAAEVFEQPWASNLPASPQPRQIFLVNIFLAVLIGSGIAHVRRKYGDRLRSSSWVNRLPAFARSAFH